MLKKQPTASAIRAANRNAVGGGRKRCRRGKNCSATCIDVGKDCLVGLPEPAAVATTKVKNVLMRRSGTGAPTQPAAPPPAQSLETLSKLVNQAKEEYEDAYGTSRQAAAKEKFEKAVENYQRAKNPTALQQSTQPAQPALSGVEAIQKMADDRKLENMGKQMDQYKAAWASTIGKGDPDATKKAWDVYYMLKGNYDTFKKEYDDKYNRPTATSLKEKVKNEAERVRNRIDRRMEEGISQWKGEQKAKAIAFREEMFGPFKKLSDDQLAALGLYGENVQKYYRDVNQFLRTGNMDGIPPQRQQIVRNIASNLNTALEKLPASPQTEFSRAVSGPGAQALASLKVGDIITDKGFGSYTLRNQVRTLDQFYDKGQPNATIHMTSRNARNVSPMMEYQRESEHIMRPGARYRVVEIRGADDPNAHRSRKVGTTPTYIFEEVE